MKGSSQRALAAARDRFDAVLAAASGDVGAQLFAVVDLLDAQPAVRRALTDPAREGEQKAALVRALWGEKLASQVVELLAAMVTDRWSANCDLGDSLEILGTEAILGTAQANGDLERLEDEVFRVDRMLVGRKELRAALVDTSRSSADRLQLATELFAKHISPCTMALLKRAVSHPRGRALGDTLASIGRQAAARRHCSLALVTTAVPLSIGQQERLADILHRAYGKPIALSVVVDPAVLGGVRVAIASDIIDGTIAARIEDVSRHVAARK